MPAEQQLLALEEVERSLQVKKRALEQECVQLVTKHDELTKQKKKYANALLGIHAALEVVRAALKGSSGSPFPKPKEGG